MVRDYFLLLLCVLLEYMYILSYLLTIATVEDQGSYQVDRDINGQERLQCHCVSLAWTSGRLPDHLTIILLYIVYRHNNTALYKIFLM